MRKQLKKNPFQFPVKRFASSLALSKVFITTCTLQSVSCFIIKLFQSVNIFGTCYNKPAMTIPKFVLRLSHAYKNLSFIACRISELIADDCFSNKRPPFGEPRFFRNIACALLMS